MAGLWEAMRALLTRLLGWFLAALLLPVFTISFIRIRLCQRTNMASVFALALYTLGNASFAWCLVGAALSSWWPATVFVVAIAAAFTYNVCIMTFVATLETRNWKESNCYRILRGQALS